MKKICVSLLAMVAMSGNAFAHPGHGLDAGFTAGLLHPLSGWDHLLVMFALGIWAARRPAAQGWPLPVLFVSILALSASLPVTWLPAPLAEALVIASVCAMGLLLLRPIQLPTHWQYALVAVAAFAHGTLHAQELGHQAAALAGMVLATALLHALGWTLGRQRHPYLQAATQGLGSIMVVLSAGMLSAGMLAGAV